MGPTPFIVIQLTAQHPDSSLKSLKGVRRLQERRANGRLTNKKDAGMNQLDDFIVAPKVIRHVNSSFS